MISDGYFGIRMIPSGVPYGITALQDYGTTLVESLPKKHYFNDGGFQIKSYYYHIKKQDIDDKYIKDGKVIPEVAILQCIADNDDSQAVFDTLEYFYEVGDNDFLNRVRKANNELQLVSNDELEWFLSFWGEC